MWGQRTHAACCGKEGWRGCTCMEAWTPGNAYSVAVPERAPVKPAQHTCMAGCMHSQLRPPPCIPSHPPLRFPPCPAAPCRPSRTVTCASSSAPMWRRAALTSRCGAPAGKKRGRRAPELCVALGSQAARTARRCLFAVPCPAQSTRLTPGRPRRPAAHEPTNARAMLRAAGPAIRYQHDAARPFGGLHSPVGAAACSAPLGSCLAAAGLSPWPSGECVEPSSMRWRVMEPVCAAGKDIKKHQIGCSRRRGDRPAPSSGPCLCAAALPGTPKAPPSWPQCGARGARRHHGPRHLARLNCAGKGGAVCV